MRYKVKDYIFVTKSKDYGMKLLQKVVLQELSGLSVEDNHLVQRAFAWEGPTFFRMQKRNKQAVRLWFGCESFFKKKLDQVWLLWCRSVHLKEKKNILGASGSTI